MSRGVQLALWPVVLGAYVVAMVVGLAHVHPFAPQAPAVVPGRVTGDVYRGQTVYERACAGCHGDSGQGGVGPALAGSGLTVTAVRAQVESGGGVMPAALVTGQDEADVAVFVAQLAGP